MDLIKNKKLLISICILSIVLVGAIGMTLSLFTSNDEVTNIFKTGEINVIPEEPDFPKDPPPWNKGEVDKKVYVKNITTENPALVRVNITPRWVEVDSENNEIPWCGDVSEKVVKLNFSGDNILEDEPYTENKWLQSSDGYYYYTSILPANEKSSDILESVLVTVNNQTVENPKDYEGKILKIDVNVESVQPTKEAYKDSWGITASYADNNVWNLLNSLTSSIEEDIGVKNE